MVPNPRRSPRRGATLAECAVVLPVTFFFLAGLIVGGMGIFRYQQVAWLAEEAARYASVRGSDYQKDTGNSSPTQSQIQTNVVQALATQLQPSYLTVQVKWLDMNAGTVTDWDSSGKAPVTTSSSGQMISSRVRVTVSYQWFPEAYLVGPITLSSTCEIPMSN